MRRLSVDQSCRDKWSCPSVWENEPGSDDLVIVGAPAELGIVPLADGEVAIRIKRSIVADADVQ